MPLPARLAARSGFMARNRRDPEENSGESARYWSSTLSTISLWLPFVRLIACHRKLPIDDASRDAELHRTWQGLLQRRTKQLTTKFRFAPQINYPLLCKLQGLGDYRLFQGEPLLLVHGRRMGGGARQGGTKHRLLLRDLQHHY